MKPQNVLMDENQNALLTDFGIAKLLKETTSLTHSGMALGTRDGVWFLRNAPDIAPRVEPAGLHDACYLPRSCHVTGDIRVHELAWATPEPREGREQR